MKYAQPFWSSLIATNVQFAIRPVYSNKFKNVFGRLVRCPGEEFVEWDFVENICHDFVGQFAKHLKNGSAHLWKHLLPMFVQKEIGIVAQCLIAIVQIPKEKYDATEFKRQFGIVWLQKDFSIFHDRFAIELERQVGIN